MDKLIISPGQIFMIIFGIIYSYFVLTYHFSDSSSDGMYTMKSTAVIAIWLVIALVLFEGLVSFNFKYLIALLPLFYFSICIVFFWAGYVITSHFPVFFFAEFGFLTLLLGGAILAWLMRFLLEVTLDFKQNYPNIILVAPVFIGIPFSLLLSVIAFDSSPEMGVVHVSTLIFPFNLVLPLFGEGSEGAVIILSVIFSFYLGIRLFDPSIKALFRNSKIQRYLMQRGLINKITVDGANNHLNQINTSYSDYLKFSMELFTAFSAISSAFAISGMIINDGTPPLESISLNIVVFSFLGVIPFLLLISRKSLFGDTNRKIIVNTS